MWRWISERSWRRLLVAWLMVTALTAGAFRVWETRYLGWNDADGTARVRMRVVQGFQKEARALEATARTIEAQRDPLVQSAADPRQARALFVLLDRATDRGSRAAATVYSPAGVPVAWSGRPTDLPRGRLGPSAALFVAPAPQGPRLFCVRPVYPPDRTRADSAGTRLATIVVESPLPTERATGAGPSPTVVWPAGPVAVHLRARYEGAGQSAAPGLFTLDAPDGTPLLEGHVRTTDVATARQRMRGRVVAFVLLITAGFAVVATAPLLAWRNRQRTARTYAAGTVAAVGLVAAARLTAWTALPGALDAAPDWGRVGQLGHPADFLLTAASMILLVAIAGGAASRVRVGVRAFRLPVGRTPASLMVFAGACLASSVTAVVVLKAMVGFVRTLATAAPTDLLAFSVHHGSSAKIPIEVGLVLASAAAVWFSVLLLRAALPWFRLEPAPRLRPVAWVAWAVPPLVWMAATGSSGGWIRDPGLATPALVAIVTAASWRRLERAYRHGSQAARLVWLFAALAIPALSWYPALFTASDDARRGLVAERLAPQALRQRDDLQARVRRALTDIDRMGSLAELAQAQDVTTNLPVSPEAAFMVWSRTELAKARLTSAIELYGPNRVLASRFALKLPDYTSAQQVWEGSGCDWELFEEISPFFSEERRLLYAGRGICAPGSDGMRVVGAIAIYAMLDYADLPFLAAQSPYVALVRGETGQDPESAQSHGLDFVVYGWSRTPVYASGSAWTLDDETFRRVYTSRTPFWTTLASGGRRYAVHVSNDRGGIYALGYPTLSAIEHLVNLAEMTVLVGLTFSAALVLSWLAAMAGGYRGLDGRGLLREVRASFYRKVFLAFVAAAAVPIITLALVAQAYLAARLLAGIEDAAGRTASVAQRVVEDYAQLQEGGERRVERMDDDILVWIARVIDQDVNVFEGTTLMATSERSLYASGVLPERTSAGIYRAIVLDRQAAHVARDRVDGFDYLSAAAPVRLGDHEAILTVPLTLRQQAIQREIDDLTRRIVLAVLAFILAGSMLGYWMAERIADPVNRLQRATARIARGDLSVRVALTSSDELRRLVEAFNQMATELQRQQGELARVYRLEAWADMARQVAHDIKNPLTPIQLSAEHLRRVHADRGQPLSPVLESCVDSILTQVRLLRQIAGEFSAFATSPTARPVDTSVDDLLSEVIDPYRAGLVGRVDVRVSVAPGLAPIRADRTLLGRALTNVIDNALHAMPGGGVLDIRAEADHARIVLRITDTGVGMDAEAAARLFEPYFSTKATGTGLGLTIAKRNVELNAGTIAVDSTPGRGTTVTIVVPSVGPQPA